MTIRENLHFTYAGVSSRSMGVLHASVDGGLFEESLFSSRSIIEEKTPYRDTPYHYGVNRDPLEFPMIIAFEDGWDDRQLKKIQNWLAQSTYQPLQFDNDSERIYYCMSIGEPKIHHNGNKEGYVTLTMRCDSPYAYSSFYVTDVYDLSDNLNGYEIEIMNHGDFICKPQVYMETLESGDFSIFNNSDGAKEFKFTGLAINENVFVDGEYEDIETDIAGLDRYDNFNGQYLELVVGNNFLRVLGNCRIYFKYRYKFL